MWQIRTIQVLILLFVLIVFLRNTDYSAAPLYSNESFNITQVQAPITELYQATPSVLPPLSVSMDTESVQNESEPSESIIPVTLEIPSINLETEIQPVGLLENGQMGVPDDFDKVGWFEPGFMPGQIGNAAIAGHLDHYTGPAVFFYLKELKQGDRIYVKDKEDKKLTFIVTSVESFKTAESPLHRIFGDADKAHLNLITCAGTFNKKTQESSHRLVVFSELHEIKDEVSSHKKKE